MPIRLLRGDANLLLPALPPESVDCVATDPPYCSGGPAPISRRQTTAAKVQDGDSARRYPPNEGDSRDQRGQLAWMTGWLSECRRLARPNGVLLLFTDWRQMPLFSDALQAGGWVWRGVAVWDKTLQARPVRGSFRHQAEFVLFATKGTWIPPTGETFPGVFTCPVGAKNHLTAKPVRLARDLLGILAPGSDVLDPFMGGGSILKGAADAGHRVLGIELQAESFGAAGRLLGVPT